MAKSSDYSKPNNNKQMKTKILIALTLMPMIGLAHPGHKHQVIDMILDPSTWSEHKEIIVLLGFVLLALMVKLGKKYTLVGKKIIAD